MIRQLALAGIGLAAIMAATGPGSATAQVKPAPWAQLQPDLPFKTSQEQFDAYKAQAHGGTHFTIDKAPDWRGLWTRDAGGPYFFNFDPAGGPDTTMPDGYGRVTAALTPVGKAALDKRQNDVRHGIEFDYLSLCLPAGYPRIMTEPFLREWIVTPEETWMITEQQSEVRRIYTDGRGHPPEDEAYPLFEGDSIGFWDGDTLVVHTNHVKTGYYQRGQPNYSLETSTVERIRKISPDVIEDRMTVYDPVNLAKPWNVLQHYTRVIDPPIPELRINMWSCEENNNVVPTADNASTFILPGEKGYKDPNTRIEGPAAH
jgi:hypothetical protein